MIETLLPGAIVTLDTRLPLNLADCTGAKAVKNDGVTSLA